jgi:hypothetical protein
MHHLTIVPMKPNPTPITDRDAERSITVTLGVFIAGFTAGVVAFAAVLAALPNN